MARCSVAIEITPRGRGALDPRRAIAPAIDAFGQVDHQQLGQSLHVYGADPVRARVVGPLWKPATINPVPRQLRERLGMAAAPIGVASRSRARRRANVLKLPCTRLDVMQVDVGKRSGMTPPFMSGVFVRVDGPPRRALNLDWPEDRHDEAH